MSISDQCINFAKNGVSVIALESFTYPLRPLSTIQ